MQPCNSPSHEPSQQGRTRGFLAKRIPSHHGGPRFWKPPDEINKDGKTMQENGWPGWFKSLKNGFKGMVALAVPHFDHRRSCCFFLAMGSHDRTYVIKEINNQITEITYRQMIVDFLHEPSNHRRSEASQSQLVDQ